MATIKQGIVGGFSGAVGPVVGYQWRGRWCMRSRPPFVRNPRTERQQQHRMMFKEEVLLASRMKWVLRESFAELSLDEGLTPCNFFIRENQHAFSWEAGSLAVDWSSLRLSMGPVAPVSFGVPQVEEETLLTICFEKNPLHVRADAYDKVYLYVYCPEAADGYLAAPVYRKTQRISVVLPHVYAGKEVQLWGLVQDEQGRWSESIYIGFGSLVSSEVGSRKSEVPVRSEVGSRRSEVPVRSEVGSRRSENSDYSDYSDCSEKDESENGGAGQRAPS